MYGYRPTTRLLSMLELLQARGRIGGPELARRLEVGERTIRRYVAMLQEMGVPVEAERGRYGTYTLGQGFKLPPMMFTDEEALALALGLLSARRLGLDGAAPAVEGALAKLERVMPDALRERVRTLEETVVPATVGSSSLQAGEVVVRISEAVRVRRRVWIGFRSNSLEETEREVDPYAVVRAEDRWYAVGYCHLRRARRLFRLDRVVGVEPREGTFRRPPGFDTPEEVLQAIAEMREDRWSVEVLLETTLDEARAQTSAIGVALEETPDGVVLRASASNLDWIALMLARFSFPFVVRRPDELRDELRRRAEELLALADRR